MADAGAALVYTSGGRCFAVPAAAVREVVIKGAITRVPGAPALVVGVAMVRGRLIPVAVISAGGAPVDEPASVTTLPRLVVLAADGEEVGVVADETLGIVDDLPSLERAAPGVVRGEVTWRDRLVARVDPAALVGAILGES